MRLWFHLGAVLLLGSVAGLCSDQKAAAKDSQASPPAAPRPAAKKNAAANAGGTPKKAQRLVNPTNPLTRLFGMTPEQRERAYERMNPQQRDRAQNLVKWFDDLPKPQQQIQLKRLEHFEQLSPEERAEVGGLLKEAQELPPARRGMVRAALARLQTMPDADRDRFLGSPQFKARFTAEEQRLITRLADAWLPPF